MLAGAIVLLALLLVSCPHAAMTSSTFCVRILLKFNPTRIKLACGMHGKYTVQV